MNNVCLPLLGDVTDRHAQAKHEGRPYYETIFFHPLRKKCFWTWPRFNRILAFESIIW
jgi:hypothetical protein